MNKNFSKTSSKSKSFAKSSGKSSAKSKRVYNLSEIRKRRKLSAKTQISFNFQPLETQWISKIFGIRRPFPPYTFGKIKGPKNFCKILFSTISFSKTSPKISPRIFPKILSKKKMKTLEVFKVPVTKSTGFKYPCLFVEKVHQKTQEVMGSDLINKLTRFITKQGKKSFASQAMDKVRYILTGFEADKKNGQETSSKFVKSDHQPPQSHKSQNDLELLGESPSPEKGSNDEPCHGLEDTDDQIILKFETYKSQKLSQFLSRQKLNSSENSGKQHDGKSLKKNQKKKGGYSLLSPNTLIEQAISSVKPFVEVKKVRVAGSTYQVPAILEKHRQENYAIKWILQSALERHKKNRSQTFEYCLAFEIYEASKKQGQARMKRNELHKLAESHRAFAHFRWW